MAYQRQNYKGVFDYLISYPEHFDEKKTYPVLMFLHGAGTRGKEIEVLENNSNVQTIPNYVGDKAIIVCPHCTVQDWNEIMKDVISFCEEIRDLSYVDARRFYLTGNSMGGYGSWELSIIRPDLFAAVAPLCGGGMAWATPRLKSMPVWAFHGLLDQSVDYAESVRMVNGVNKNGGNARLTIYENLAHNIWTTVYNDPALYEWFFKQTKGATETGEKLAGANFG